MTITYDLINTSTLYTEKITSMANISCQAILYNQYKDVLHNYYKDNLLDVITDKYATENKLQNRLKTI